MKKKKHSHIKKAERLEIAILLKRKYGVREIARALHRSPATISEEIKNNSVKGVYNPQKAHHKAYVKRKYSKYQGMNVADNPALWDYIKEKIKEDWSPEMISGRIRKIDNQIRSISPKGIYKFVFSVYGRNLERFLAYKGRKRKPKTTRKVLSLKERMFIDQRPKIVDKRKRFGDWEGDFIVSGREGKGVLLVFYERKSKYVILKKLLSKKIEEVHRAIYEITGGVFMNTLTLDNDIVFRKHKELSEILGTPIYFCHPYHSWEKGGVENTNKLIRRYISKGSDISQYSNQYIRMIEDKLNDRPRKCLNYKTPNEVMRENRQFKEEAKYRLDDILKVGEIKKAECSV